MGYSAWFPCVLGSLSVEWKVYVEGLGFKASSLLDAKDCGK